MRQVLIACVLATALMGISAAAIAVDKPTAASRPAATDALQQSVAARWRDPNNTARDRYRHPLETLAFFNVKQEQTVIEITPGSGWYSEILGPLLREHGHYIAAVADPMAVEAGRGRDSRQKAKSSLEAKFAAAPAQLDRAQVVAYDPDAPAFGAPGSADVVLTFRNVHNWRAAKQAEGMFRGFFAVLKPGGVLGVVEHRAASDVADDDKSGYVGERQVVAMATAAGFRLDAKSEVNANPKDTKDYPGGVWTLPPTNDHDAKDDAKYRAIGESDRMTLRFVKP
jgi:predicted methyltransferase